MTGCPAIYNLTSASLNIFSTHDFKVLCHAIWYIFKKLNGVSRINQGHPMRNNTIKAQNAVFCFLVSFYGLLKGYLCELTLFDLFGCCS